MDELGQATNVIFVVMRQSNDRDPANADGVQPVGKAIPVRSDINERSLKAARTRGQRIDDRQTVALSDVQAVDTDIQCTSPVIWFSPATHRVRWLRDEEWRPMRLADWRDQSDQDTSTEVLTSARYRDIPAPRL